MGFKKQTWGLSDLEPKLIANQICDWICEKGSYTRNYKYLEIQF